MSGLDMEKLAKLQAATRIGGKGTPRRKIVAKVRPGQADDKKLQGALKKLNVQPVQGVEEVNFFKEDGNVLHFTAPKVHAALGSNTFAIYGAGQDKEITELVPGILGQLGPDAMANLRRIAETYQAQQQNPGPGIGSLQADKEADDDSDDEPPELVEATAPTTGGGLEELN